METFTVAVTDYGFPDLRQEKEVLEPLGCSIVTGQCTQPEEVVKLASEADAILTQWAPINADVIRQLNRCRVIVRYGIGVDNVDLEAARDRHIPVVNVPDYAVQEVADHTLSLMLASVRNIPQIVSQVRSGVWEIAPCRPILGLQGRKLGLAGFGHIAQSVAVRAKAFGMEVFAYDPYVKDEVFSEAGVRRVSWDELVRESDMVSVHLPLTNQTKHLFQASVFAQMKKEACLVNTSRGGVVHTEDLIQALRTGEIAKAALDVLEEEPIARDHPLLQMEQCLVTSHCAWYSEQSLQRLQLFAAQEVARVLTGGQPKHVVNK